MTQSIDRLDRLVEDYLGAVSYACRDLPPEQREDLVGDLREHIAAARAVLYQPTEAAVRTILDRIGEPGVIAAEARLDAGLGVAPPPATRQRDPGPPVSRWMSRPMPPTTVAILVVLAVAALTIVTLAYLLTNSPPPPPIP